MAEQSSEISVATYVKRVNDRFGEDEDIVHAIVTNAPDLASRIVEALFETGIDLAESIQISLISKETLSRVDDRHPKSTTPVAVDREKHIVSPEILGWSIAVLASAWTQWIFASKSNEQSMYQTDPEFNNNKYRIAARANVKLVLPYIRCSILDILDKGTYIGNCSDTNFEPKPGIEPVYLELRKDCNSD